MATARTNKVSTTNNNTKADFQVQDEEGKPKKESSIGRKISHWFQGGRPPRKNVLNIPGKSMAFFDYMTFQTQGLEALTKKREKYNCNLFRFHLEKEKIFLCDWRSSQDLFDTGKVDKELTFGHTNFSTANLDNYTPAMFSNGINHSKRKAFLTSITKWVEQNFLYSAIIKMIPDHIKSWNVTPGEKDPSDLETSILLMVDDIVSEMFLGTWLNFDALQLWREAMLRRHRKTFRRYAKEAYQELYHTIVRCPRIKEILIQGRSAGLDYDEIIKEILFALAFNSTALSYALMSLIGRLTLLPKLVIRDLKQEIEKEVSNELSQESLKKLKEVESVVLEILRLHPPVPLLYGKARSDFVTESSSCHYQIRKDESLVCSVYQIQRDPQLYELPAEFQHERFRSQCPRNQIISFGGNMNDSPSPQNHKCIGQEISLAVLKVSLVHLVYCKINLKEDPQWIGKRRQRFGRPDKPLQLDVFVYRQAPFTHRQSMEVIDWDECEE